MFLCDDFIKNTDLIDAIKNDTTFFPENMGDLENIGEYNNYFHSGESSCRAPYMFWDGWWRSPANTLKKQIIQSVWGSRLDYQHDDILGFEYWTRTYRAGQFLATHVDEDTFLYADKKIFRGPAIGCVYYPHTNDVVGGFLELHPTAVSENTEEALEMENIDPLIVPIELRERIACNPNRLIIFDAGHIIHNTTAPVTGVRRVMVVNVWHKDSPPTALETGQFFYE